VKLATEGAWSPTPTNRGAGVAPENDVQHGHGAHRISAPDASDCGALPMAAAGRRRPWSRRCTLAGTAARRLYLAAAGRTEAAAQNTTADRSDALRSHARFTSSSRRCERSPAASVLGISRAASTSASWLADQRGAGGAGHKGTCVCRLGVARGRLEARGPRIALVLRLRNVALVAGRD
jgi:hypothetical protein